LSVEERLIQVIDDTMSNEPLVHTLGRSHGHHTRTPGWRRAQAGAASALAAAAGLADRV